jgi:hypothetical protein
MSYSIDQFETESHSEIVQGRLKEVCPPTLLAEMDADEIERAVNVGFQIINYKPVDVAEAMRKANENSTAVWLWEYIYDVWRCDN